MKASGSGVEGQSGATAAVVVVPFGVADEQVYLAGRIAAEAYALSHGFSPDTFIEIKTEWGQMDPNAHLNNAVYFKYLEAGRIGFIRAFARTLGPAAAKEIVGSGTGKGIILGSVSNKYLVRFASLLEYPVLILEVLADLMDVTRNAETSRCAGSCSGGT